MFTMAERMRQSVEVIKLGNGIGLRTDGSYDYTIRQVVEPSQPKLDSSNQVPGVDWTKIKDY